MWTYQTVNIIHNILKVTKSFSLSSTNKFAECRNKGVNCPHPWSLEHTHMFTQQKNQFIVALVPQRQELKRFLK